MAKRKSKGLGDTIEAITEATGIKAGVEALSKALDWDCGCDERKEKLNKIFPYKKPNCLAEDDYLYLSEFFASNPNTLSLGIQRDLQRIYLAVFNTPFRESSCPSCWRDMIGELRRVYNEFD
jgi:hypothetical protein